MYGRHLVTIAGLASYEGNQIKQKFVTTRSWQNEIVSLAKFNGHSSFHIRAGGG
mgnify:CR=1 FL=1